MANAQDGQTLFNGGMNQLTSPWLLGETQYADASNIESRSGDGKSRRGSRVVFEWQDSDELMAVHAYTAPTNDQRRDTVITVRSGDVYYHKMPFPPQKMGLPTGVTIDTSEDIQFVQAYDYLYMLRGKENAPLRWDGYKSSDWEELPEAETGDQFPNGETGTYAYNRLWIATDDVVDASDLLSEEFDLAFNSYQINNGEGGSIIALLQFVETSILVFKDSAIHCLTNCSGDLSNISRYVIDPKRGCVARNSIVRVGNDVLYLSRDGVRTIALTDQNNAQLVDLTLSYVIPDAIDRINWSAADQAHAVVYDNYYLIAVPVDGSSTNNAVLVYDFTMKSWVAVWEGMAVEKMLTVPVNGVDWLIGMNAAGDAVRLLTDFYEDNVPSDPPYLDFDNAISQSINCDAVISGIDTFTNGYISLDLLIGDANLSTEGTMFWIGPISGFFDPNFIFFTMSILTNQIKLYFWYDTGAAWEAVLDATPYSNTGWRNFCLAHNGTEPELYVDGVKQAITITGAEQTRWLPDLQYADAYRIGGANILFFLNKPFSGGMKNLGIFKIDGSSNRTWHSFFAMNEGTGSTINEQINDVDCTMINPSWVNPTAASDIESNLLTRAFTFGTQGLMKQLMSTEITVAHRNPKFSIDITKDGAFESDSLIADKEYSSVEYDVHGIDDWTGTGIDFADPYRKNYAPVDIGSGIKLESLLSEEYGVKLDQIQKHTEKRFLGDTVDYVQFEMSNTQGSADLKMIAALANAKQFGHRSED